MVVESLLCDSGSPVSAMEVENFIGSLVETDVGYAGVQCQAGPKTSIPQVSDAKWISKHLPCQICVKT